MATGDWTTAYFPEGEVDENAIPLVTTDEGAVQPILAVGLDGQPIDFATGGGSSGPDTVAVSSSVPGTTPAAYASGDVIGTPIELEDATLTSYTPGTGDGLGVLTEAIVTDTGGTLGDATAHLFLMDPTASIAADNATWTFPAALGGAYVGSVALTGAAGAAQSGGIRKNYITAATSLWVVLVADDAFTLGGSATLTVLGWVER